MKHLNLIRKISTCSILSRKTVPNNLKGKSVSSQHWLTRQLQDPYVEKAKLMNYRCRSAFKLLEIDGRFKILNFGQTVIDCGAAPGSWSQVAVEKVNANGKNQNKPKGTVIAIDKQQIYPLEHVNLFTNMDFTRSENQLKIKEHLKDGLVDIVLSDMAPKASGIKSLDQENILTLCYSALKFAIEMSKPNGILLVKLWQGSGDKKLEKDLLNFYESVKIVKPTSSRSDSAEMFLLARGFKRLER